MRSVFFLLSLLAGNLLLAQNDSIVRLHEDLEIVKLTENVWIHRSYASLEAYGRFYSNGMIYVEGSHCLVFDTPMSDSISTILLLWLEQELDLRIQGIVVNHFHDDCLGGLEVFHRRGIPSYSTRETQVQAEVATVAVPLFGFRIKKSLSLKRKKVQLFYPGPAHTQDNIVAWLPAEKVLFGGCMVKSVGAKKGNLVDADTTAWSGTIRKVTARFPDAQWVIPGHGKAGGPALLDYTIELFRID